jgi:hypothetical protein
MPIFLDGERSHGKQPDTPFQHHLFVLDGRLTVGKRSVPAPALMAGKLGRVAGEVFMVMD